MGDAMHIEVSNETVSGRSRRTTHVTGQGLAVKDVYYEFDRVMPWVDDMPLDGHVLGVLLHAAAAGRTLHVHGGVTRGMLRHMDELLMVWSRWKPDSYKHIDIIAERVIDGGGMAASGKAIAAFSGGVDATFTALRHTALLPADLRYGLDTLLIVHGFDVRLDNEGDFEKLCERAQPVVRQFQMNLRVMRTNSKEMLGQHWEDSFGLELAACLHMYSAEFAAGLIGSSEPYDALVLPWGSTPVTDPLLSGDCFRVVHDGAGFSRTEKVAALAQQPALCKALKVCWRCEDQSSNCGVCEKCVRTRLNFLAVGGNTLSFMPGELVLSDIRRMVIHNAAQLAELAGIVQYCDAHGVAGEWLPVLRRRVARWKPPVKRESRGKVEKLVIRGLAAAGLKDTVKRMVGRAG